MKLLKLLLLPYMAAVIAAAFLWPEPAEGFIGRVLADRLLPRSVRVDVGPRLPRRGRLLARLPRSRAIPGTTTSPQAAVRLGLLFAVLTLVTGSLFAKIMWGSYWNWDPRESSYLLLVFLYGAYLFLRAAVDDPERRARIGAAYALFAAVLMPFLVFVAPRVTASLHPQTVINPQGKILMDTPTKAVFFGGSVGFTGLFLWMLELEARLRDSRRDEAMSGQTGDGFEECRARLMRLHHESRRKR